MWRIGFVIGVVVALVLILGSEPTSAKRGHKWGSSTRTDELRGRVVQRSLTTTMTGRQGSAVVVDVPSGKLIASYNLEKAGRRLALPGSVVKPFTLLALLRSGKVDAHAPMVCRRRIAVGAHKLDCGHPLTGRGLDAVAALAYSCNDYFTTMAKRVTAGELRQELLRAGLAGRSGFVEDEASGEVRLSMSVEQVQMQAIGEENVQVTTLVLAAAYTKLAMQRNAPSDAKGDIKNDEALATVFAGIEAATDYGMARRAQPATKMKVAGKTGTSLAESGQWTHAWFAGFAPAEKPEVVVVVFLERGSGGADAAPIAAKVFEAWSRGRR